MATTRTFNDMLNEHLDYDLLKAEYLERNWLLNFVERDESWKGGTVPVPFRGYQASTVKFGALPTGSDVGESKYVRGTLSSYKELWGTLKFNHTDLIQHDGKMSEASFLKVLPGEIDDFLKYMKERASLHLLNGYIAKATANGNSSGEITVDHPERFHIGQQVTIDDDDASALDDCYVRTIDMNTGVLTIYDDRTAGSVVNLSAVTVAQNARLYEAEADSDGFTSLRSQLLSEANGGSSTIAGVTKTLYPYTQSLNLDGSSFTENNILEGVFNKYVTARNRCSGNPQNLVCSYKNGAAIIKNLESGKGAYNVVAGSKKASAYGWDEIMIGGPKGGLKVVQVQEMEDDVMYMLSDKGIKFHSNGFIQKRTAPDGKSFYEVRETTGYYYLVDMFLFGDLVVNRPSDHAVIHGINFSLTES